MKNGKTRVRLHFGDGRETSHEIDGVAETPDEEGEQMDVIIAATCVAGLDLTGIEFGPTKGRSAAKTG